MRDWWHNPTQVSQSLRLQARDAYIPANTDYTIWNWGTQATNAAWLSTPVQGSNTVPDNPVFFLSEAEVYQRMGQTTAALRQTNSIAANGTVGDISTYWLRSAAQIANHIAVVGTFANPNGHWNWASAHATNTGAAFRPTIWVRR